MREYVREVITEDIQRAYYDLLESYEGKNENDLQRKFAMFMHFAKENERLCYYEELRENYFHGGKKAKVD